MPDLPHVKGLQVDVRLGKVLHDWRGDRRRVAGDFSLGEVGVVGQAHLVFKKGSREGSLFASNVVLHTQYRLEGQVEVENVVVYPTSLKKES